MHALQLSLATLQAPRFVYSGVEGLIGFVDHEVEGLIARVRLTIAG